jgi:hypothetical protein
MRSLTRTQRQAAVVTAVFCLPSLPAGAAGLYSTNAGFHVDSAPANDRAFGRAVASGDFNGDGTDDLATASAAGIAVRYGAPGVGLAATGAASESGVGLASGDFNGDGSDDLAVGNGVDVVTYYGSSGGLASTPSFPRFGTYTSGIGGDSCPLLGNCYQPRPSMFGAAVTAADFDADGFDDLVIGHADYRSDFDYHTGRIIVLYGTASGLSTAGLRKFSQDHPGMDGSNETNDYFGAALASGDFDNDGFADVVVGVPGENDGGGFHVIYGSPAGLTEAGNNLWAQNDSGVPDDDEMGDNLGYALAVADFDGDGFDDVAVAAPYEDLELSDDTTLIDAGAVSVFFGSAAGITTADAFAMTQTGTTLGDSEGGDVWGQALAAGDFDRDGYADLAVAAPGEYLESYAAVGELTVVRGFPTGLTKDGGRCWQQNKPGVPDTNEPGDLFGRALATGDFDANGYADLAIGGPGESTGAFSHNGAEWVLSGYLFADGFELGDTSAWEQRTSNPRNSNNVFAYPVTGLGPPESQWALRVNLLNPSATLSRPAWVKAGPARGFSNETRLRGSFFIDPQALTMSTAPGAGAFQMMAFTDGPDSDGATHLSFDLDRNVGAGGWAIIASYWNEAIGALQPAGSAFFAPAGDANWRNNRIDFDWRGGNPGHLTMWRTHYVNGAPDANGRIQMMSVDLPGSANGRINEVNAGMVSGQDAGTYGALYLDEFSFSDPLDVDQ